MRASRVNPTRQAIRPYFFRFGRGVRAEAAADFAVLFDFAISITSLLSHALRSDGQAGFAGYTVHDRPGFLTHFALSPWRLRAREKYSLGRFALRE